MSRFSPIVSNFLKKIGADPRTRVSIVTVGSCYPGDILFFRYQLGEGVGSRAARVFLLVKPVFRSARTGNKLMTGFTLPVDANFNLDSLEVLYKLGELKQDQGLDVYEDLENIEGESDPVDEMADIVIPEDSYRTYIVSRVWGPLRKISRLEE